MKNKKENKRPSAESTEKIPKKACSEKHCNLCKKMGLISHGQHTRLLQVQEEWKQEIRLPNDQERHEETQSHKAVFHTIVQENEQA